MRALRFQWSCAFNLVCKVALNLLYNPGFDLLLGVWVNRGPLHTRVKSRAHEIVRAQKKVSKGRPNTPPKSCSVVTCSQA